ncbi:MAG TPA: YraN family protein [Candidatus Avidesulfovibrio excrementigallinarum]|nr:YraN family protein [Candidatus Avidesulfovibrio excrementigallinarum]
MFGRAAEDAAASFLRRRGLRVLERNWRCGPLELDLVCEDGDTLVFVEVRARDASGMVSPLESLTPAKRRALCNAAQCYLDATDGWARPCRFDVVAALGRRGQTSASHLQLEHFTNVMHCDAMGGGHTAW